MKNILSFVFVFVFTNCFFSQTYNIEFEGYLNFNVGKYREYKDVIDTTKYLETKKNRGGVNSYTIDLTNNTVTRYFNGAFQKTKTINSYEKKDNLIVLRMNDNESSTGNSIISTIVINTNKNDKTNPYFLLYFVSSVTNTTNGSIVYNK
jgi:hypothetical protein